MLRTLESGNQKNKRYYELLENKLQNASTKFDKNFYLAVSFDLNIYLLIIWNKIINKKIINL
jgi:NADH:ubiquinone oxidoreductase subunit 3 (subunit A)